MMRNVAFALALLVAACGGKKDEAPAAGSAARPAETDNLQKAADEAQQAAEHAKAAAEAAANKAVDEAKAARGQLDQVAKDLEALDTKVNAAVDDLAKATSDAERTKAKAALEELKKQKAELEAKIKAAKGAP